jgi:hypothetical protein
MRKLITLLLCSIAFSSSTCRKSGFDCTVTTYNFKAEAKVLNHSDSISVGDTIWLAISCPVSQIDNNSSKLINYSKAVNFGTAIGLGELVLPSGREAANDFNYYLLRGIQVNNPNTNVIREYLFSENLSSYEFLLGVIPKRKGTFSIGLSNAANVYRNDDKCTKASYRIYFTDTNQHLYYIKQVFGTEPDGTERTYCFKVI